MKKTTLNLTVNSKPVVITVSGVRPSDCVKGKNRFCDLVNDSLNTACKGMTSTEAIKAKREAFAQVNAVFRAHAIESVVDEAIHGKNFLLTLVNGVTYGKITINNEGCVNDVQTVEKSVPTKDGKKTTVPAYVSYKDIVQAMEKLNAEQKKAGRDLYRMARDFDEEINLVMSIYFNAMYGHYSEEVDSVLLDRHSLEQLKRKPKQTAENWKMSFISYFYNWMNAKVTAFEYKPIKLAFFYNENSVWIDLVQVDRLMVKADASTNSFTINRKAITNLLTVLLFKYQQTHIVKSKDANAEPTLVTNVERIGQSAICTEQPEAQPKQSAEAEAKAGERAKAGAKARAEARTNENK